MENEKRITELEIKFSYQEELLVELNLIVSNQSLIIDRLVKEMHSIKITISEQKEGSEEVNLSDEVPPHY
jgi:SlyX protein